MANGYTTWYQPYHLNIRRVWENWNWRKATHWRMRNTHLSVFFLYVDGRLPYKSTTSDSVQQWHRNKIILNIDRQKKDPNFICKERKEKQKYGKLWEKEQEYAKYLWWKIWLKFEAYWIRLSYSHSFGRSAAGIFNTHICVSECVWA